MALSVASHMESPILHEASQDYRLLPYPGSPCLWTIVPFRPGGDPHVKTSGDELTQGVVITYVNDLLLTGWQHHSDAITKALLEKYVMKRSGSLPYAVQGET